jgi:lipopolysaccharide biosynthesis regulator YciM
MKIMILITSILMLAGCATSSDYSRYAAMQAQIHKSQSDAEIAKANAIKELGATGGDAAKVAAVMALMIPSGGQYQQQIAAPRSVSEQIRDWVGILVPSLIQGYGIHANQQIAVTQSNNNRDVAVSTNSAFVGIAGKIQAPAANVTSTFTDSHNTDSHTADSHTVDSHAIDSHATDNHSALTCTTGPC